MKASSNTNKAQAETKATQRRVDELLVLSQAARERAPDDARRYAREAERLADLHGYGTGRARAILRLAEVELHTQHITKAQALFSEVEKLGRKLEDGEVIVDALTGLAAVHCELGHYGEALECARRGLTLSENIAYRKGIGYLCTRKGLILHTLGNRAEALESLQRALDVLRSCNDQHGLQLCLANLALVYQDNDELHKALDYCRESLAIARNQGDRNAEAVALANIGRNFFLRREYGDALRNMLEGLAIFRDLGDRKRESILLQNIAGVHGSAGDHERALPVMQASLALAQELDDAYAIMVAECGLGGCYTELGRFDEGFELLFKGLAYAEEQGMLHLQSKLQHGISSAYAQQKDMAKALEYHKRFHTAECKVYNDDSETKMRRLQVLHELEQTKTEAELHRLKSVELADANGRLEKLVRANNEFLGIAAHDLKNPLATIKALAVFMQRQADQLSQSETLELCDDIESSAVRMLNLVNNLLDINRIDQGRLRILPMRFDFAALCERYLSVYEEQARKKGIALRFDGSDQSVQAFADRDVTIQVLDNLVSNAVKYSPCDSAVDLRVFGRTTEVGTLARLEVADNGPGIAADEMPRLFQKFARLSAQPTAGEDSTGLGLSIVKTLVETMGGAVWCESVPGEGATFIVELPSDSNGEVDPASACL